MRYLSDDNTLSMLTDYERLIQHKSLKDTVMVLSASYNIGLSTVYRATLFLRSSTKYVPRVIRKKEAQLATQTSHTFSPAAIAPTAVQHANAPVQPTIELASRLMGLVDQLRNPNATIAELSDSAAACGLKFNLSVANCN